MSCRQPGVPTHPGLRFLSSQVIKQFRDEELEHHDTGLDHDAELVGATLPVLLPGHFKGCGGQRFLFPEGDI